MAPKYTLNYFDIEARAETIRLLFHAAGTEFTDNRVKWEDWAAQKTDARRFPLASMPTLEVEGKVIIQSQAIGRYVSRQLGFYGDNADDAAVIDQVCETVMDYRNALEGMRNADEETKKTKFAEFFGSDKLKLQFGFMSNVLKNNNGPFFLGEKPSYADILFYGTHILIILVNPTYLDEFGELKALIERIKNIEGIKKYLDSKKK